MSVIALKNNTNQKCAPCPISQKGNSSVPTMLAVQLSPVWLEISWLGSMLKTVLLWLMRGSLLAAAAVALPVDGIPKPTVGGLEQLK
jgi:hypothetical protein